MLSSNVPQRQIAYRSSRQKLLLIGGGLSVIALVSVAAIFFFGGRKEPPPHASYPTSKGQPYHEVVARLPAPQTTPKEKAKEQFTRRNPTATSDAALTAPIAVQNQGGWSQTFLKPTSTQQRVASNDDEDGEGGGGEDNPLSQSLKTSDLGKKSMGRIDRDYLYEISAGRKLPCNTTTSTNSQLLGFVTCDIQGDVTNDSGTALLLRNGTHVFGEYKQAILHGNNRLFVVWREIRTDDTPPCKIPISSPAADKLGAAGMPMEVDDHFWSIFWATAVYTVLEAAPSLGIAALQNSSHNNSTNIYPYYQLATPGQSMGSRMLQEKMNQPPTGEAHLGEPLIIFVGSEINMKKCVHFDLARSIR